MQEVQRKLQKSCSCFRSVYSIFCQDLTRVATFCLPPCVAISAQLPCVGIRDKIVDGNLLANLYAKTR